MWIMLKVKSMSVVEVAQDALTMQFSPPTVNGKGVVVEVKQPFHFSLLN